MLCSERFALSTLPLVMVGYSGYAKYITRTRLVTLGYGRVMGLRVPKPRTCPPYFEVEELVHAVHVA